MPEIYHRRYTSALFSCSLSSISLFVGSSAFADMDQDTRLQLLENQIKNQQQQIDQLSKQSTPKVSAPASANPDISLVLDGKFVTFSNDTPPQHDGLLAGDSEALSQGLSLGESELTISSNIDDHFFGQMTASLSDDEGKTSIDLEEAFIQSTVAPGVKVRAGRFLSGFGYLNEQHMHAWDFSTAPLIYQDILGGPLNDNGLQVSYLFPMKMYLLMGTEALRGEHYPATADKEIGAWTGYLNLGDDLTDKVSWLLGASHYQGRAENRMLSTNHDSVSPAMLTGDADISSLEAVFKWAPTGNAKQQQVKLQAEYMRASDKGNLALAMNTGAVTDQAIEADKHGYYLQASYQWTTQWCASVRYENLRATQSADTDILNQVALSNSWNAEAQSIALDWVPSEFSRIRLQFNHDHFDSNSGDAALLNYTVSLGAHGAHRY